MEIQAVIKTGGKQYQVSKGSKIKIEKLEGEAGTEIVFDQVLLVTGDATKVGSPFLSGAKVTGTILSQGLDKKIVVYKFKRRKGYHKKQGHRQDHTSVEIKAIQA